MCSQVLRRFYYCLLLCPLILILSCTSSPKKDLEGALRLGVYHKPSTINPLTTDSTISANLMNLIFDPLLLLSEDGQLKPHVATRWEVSPDGLTWTFFLRDDILFHDGKKLDASDVKFTYDTLREGKRSGYINYLKFISSVKVLDPKTLQVSLNQYDSRIFVVFSGFGIAPKHLMEGQKDYAVFNEHPIGSGPYTFVKQDQQEIILERSSNYFSGAPRLKKWIVRIYPNQTSVLSHLISDQIDMAFLTNPEDYGSLEKIPTIKIYDNWYPMLYSLLFNGKEKLFSEPRVRQALNQLINKEELVSRVLKGKGLIAQGTLHPDSQEFGRSSGQSSYAPQSAMMLLKSLGWEDHDGDSILDRGRQKFEFTVYGIEGEGVAQQSLRIIQQQFSECGIRMNIRMLPFDEYIQKVFREQNFEANMIYLVFRPFYDNDFSFWHSSQINEGMNFAHYQNAKVDHLLESMRSERSPDIRQEFLSAFQKEILEKPPGVFLFWRRMPIAMNARFQNVPQTKIQSLRDLMDIDRVEESH